MLLPNILQRRLIAEENAGEEIMNGNADIFEEEITDVSQVPEDVLDALPWGADDDRTIKEYIENTDEED